MFSPVLYFTGGSASIHDNAERDAMFPGPPLLNLLPPYLGDADPAQPGHQHQPQAHRRGHRRDENACYRHVTQHQPHAVSLHQEDLAGVDTSIAGAERVLDSGGRRGAHLKARPHGAQGEIHVLSKGVEALVKQAHAASTSRLTVFT